MSVRKVLLTFIVAALPFAATAQEQPAQPQQAPALLAPTVEPSAEEAAEPEGAAKS